jgi:hypothetical protein
MKRFRLSRRALLRGAGGAAGVTVGLPVLEAMLDGKGSILGTANAQTGGAPLRLLAFFCPNGVHRPDYEPTTTGTGYTMPPSLAPLDPYRNDFNIISGLNAAVSGGLGDAHGKGIGSFLTGLPLNSVAASGPSMDQLAAKSLGNTAIRSLVVSAASGNAGSFDADGVDSNIVYSNISYSAQNAPVPPFRSPSSLFTTVFGSPVAAPTPGTTDTGALYEKSVLDYVLARINTLNGKLGASDRVRLDAHLTAIRELEARIQTTTPTPTTSSCAQPAAPTSTTNFTTRANLLIDLMAMAVVCDRTRFATFMLTNAAGNEDASNGGTAGQPQGHHAAAHASDYPTVAGFSKFYLSFAARLLSKLAVAEGTSRVLDNCLILVGNELSNGSQHVSTNMPCIVAGKAGGKVTTGRHLRYTTAPRITQLQLSMLQLVGLNATSFADATSPLAGFT